MSNFLKFFVVFFVSANCYAFDLESTIGVWERKAVDGAVVEKITNSLISKNLIQSNISYYKNGKIVRFAAGAFSDIGEKRVGTLHFDVGMVARLNQISKDETSILFSIDIENNSKITSLWTQMEMKQIGDQTVMLQTIWKDKDLNSEISKDIFTKL